ncbi:hypothetical protein GCM10010532_052030 [Dactylosporangium siamense]|uniref:Uncharacterized protein n=2 Tax=Dactylosporangium siamense TaxID=685454 RepID=A0A919U875_9ACTN|nr:hypothetical protein Dsi01nite_034580 [Dactylosporangium siamense]
MRPEARQRLDEQYQRMVGQAKQRSAANWRHAVQVGLELGMGEPLGLYHRTEITPPVRLRRGRFVRWLYAYPDGLVEVDPGVPPRPVRWDEVTGVVDHWTPDVSESESSWSYKGFLLTAGDDRTVTIRADYQNALDPYGPGGGFFAALVPAEVAADFPLVRPIADLITEQAVARVVARQVEAVRAGRVVRRGDVRVTPAGIVGPKDAGATPWAEIERVELRPGRVDVRLTNGKSRRYVNYLDGSGYSVLCQLLVGLGAQASYEARG